MRQGAGELGWGLTNRRVVFWNSRSRVSKS